LRRDSSPIWIGETGHERIITTLIDDLEADFRRWPEFTESPRFAAHSPLGVTELMPANDREHYAFQYVNGHPSNPGRGLQTVTAFGVLADVDSGYRIFISEMTLLTALRTAAVSGLAARHLAPAGASRAAFIGAGSQPGRSTNGAGTVCWQRPTSTTTSSHLPVRDPGVTHVGGGVPAQWPAIWPPSTCTISPVTNGDDSRKRMAPTTSPTWPTWPIGGRRAPSSA
jgi:hypothetical protein